MKDAAWNERLAALLFTLLPHHALSRLVYRLTRIEHPRVTAAIRWFIKTFGVDMSDALEPDPAAYKTFNEFFVRELKPGARPLAEGDNLLTSPVDGTVSQCGDIRFDHVFQAKNHCYSTLQLLGDDHAMNEQFRDGKFATIYLAPYNYHRIHMPLGGRLQRMLHVPGRLFSVAPWTVNSVPALFARNERVVCLFDTDAGPLAMILVGAINVAAIETVWHGLVTPPAGKRISRYSYEHADRRYARGEEMGRFNMGSTVILLATPSVSWGDILTPGQTLKMGQKIASYQQFRH